MSEATDLNLSILEKRQRFSSLELLPHNYEKTLSTGLAKLNNLFYKFCETNGYNPVRILQHPWESEKDGEIHTVATDTVEIQISGDMAVIKMPYLPKRGTSAHSLANDLLLARFSGMKGLPKWEACHMEVYHVFPSFVYGVAKDVDNYDYKRTIDLLAFFFGFADTARTFTLGLQTVFTDDLESGAYIEITPMDVNSYKLPQWKGQPKTKNR